MVSGTCGTKEHVVSTTSASDDYVDIAQYDSCMQTIGISTKETLSYTSAQVMLENTTVFSVVTGASQTILLKTNEFVKQVSILPIFIFYILSLLKDFYLIFITNDINWLLLYATV